MKSFSKAELIGWAGAAVITLVSGTAIAFQTFETKESHNRDVREMRESVLEMRKEFREDLREIRTDLNEIKKMMKEK